MAIEIPITFRTDGDWGSGVGRRLLSSEVDANFAALVAAINDVVEQFGTPVGIADIVVDGSMFTVLLTNAETLGPFPLPVARPRFVGPWANGMPLEVNDIVEVDNLGLFWVLVAHTTPASPGVFDPEARDGEGNSLYQQVFGPRPITQYDIQFAIVGPIPGDAGFLAGYVVPSGRQFTLLESMEGAAAYLRVAPTQPITFEILKNMSTIGFIEFEPEPDVDGGAVGTFIFPNDVVFEEGDRLLLYAPNVEDETAADLIVTLIGSRLAV